MEKQDFINALDAIGKIRDAIMKDCNHYTGFDSGTITTVRLELDAISALEQARQALIKVRDDLLLYPEDYYI